MNEKQDEVTLYCVKCRAPHVGEKEEDFPPVCPECGNKSPRWTVTQESDDNESYWGKRKVKEKEKEELAKETKKGMAAIQKCKEMIENGNPLYEILKFVESHHIGEKKTIATAVIDILKAVGGSGGMLKVVGGSSSGKSDMVNGVLKCFPKSWVIKVGDLSANALKYINWSKHGDAKILYIQEMGGAKEGTKEGLKLMSADDGGYTAMVTRGNPQSGFYIEEINIPVKYVITTSAKVFGDHELETRQMILSIDETSRQTQSVIGRRCDIYAGKHNPMADAGMIQFFMESLREFDEIIVPFSYIFGGLVSNKILRARRDINKINELAQMSAFLNQHQRPQTERDGKRILIATPEDAYNVFNLCADSFEETLTGLPKAIQNIYDHITGEPKMYRDIAKEVNRSKRTVEIAVDKLEDLNYIVVDRQGAGKSNLITRNEDVELIKIDSAYKKYHERIVGFVDKALNTYEIAYEIPQRLFNPLEGKYEIPTKSPAKTPTKKEAEPTKKKKGKSRKKDKKTSEVNHEISGVFRRSLREFGDSKINIKDTKSLQEGNTTTTRGVGGTHKGTCGGACGGQKSGETCMPPERRVVVDKLLKIMRTNPSKEWHIGELKDKTGYESKEIKGLLCDLTYNPNNPTPIRKKDDRGDCYVLNKRNPGVAPAREPEKPDKIGEKKGDNGNHWPRHCIDCSYFVLDNNHLMEWGRCKRKSIPKKKTDPVCDDFKKSGGKE